MSAITAKTEVASALHGRRIPPLATAVEIFGVFTGILLYIWRWQYTHPYAWIALLAIVLLSHVLHRDRLKEMGLTGHEFGPCARLVFPLPAAITVLALLYAFWNREWVIMLPYTHAWISFAGYTLWCSFQQYLTQSYFHRRLRTIIKTPHLSSLAVAIMFAGAHIPNPVLLVATFAGGFLLAEVFARHPNIWPLALVQAIAGFLIGVLVPASLIHGMRVGPGYYFYNLH
ncbi:MAG TPA: CPBP family glutamic-type intramembrane protease [Terriglobia bacterium]|nr:CPBP family glutamic-type intramembrane protease [Terriglobia bacterium]